MQAKPKTSTQAGLGMRHQALVRKLAAIERRIAQAQKERWELEARIRLLEQPEHLAA